MAVLGRLGCTGSSWLVLAVLGRLGCTRRTEQHARGPVKKSSSTIFTVKNWAADKKTCKVMSAGCTICNIYNRHTVFIVKNVEDAHGSSNTLVVKSRPVVRRLKLLGYATYTCRGCWNQVQQTRTGCGKPGDVRPFAAPPPVLTRAAGKR